MKCPRCGIEPFRDQYSELICLCGIEYEDNGRPTTEHNFVWRVDLDGNCKWEPAIEVGSKAKWYRNHACKYKGGRPRKYVW